jgi:4-hydroxy-tetrahydrodipicolinate reductase
MGRRVVAVASDDPAVRLIAGVEFVGNPLLGTDIGSLAGLAPCGIALTSGWPDWRSVDGPRAVIDFSLPVAVQGCVDECVRGGVPLVVATTGLEPAQHESLRKASESIPVCWAPSMSLAVNLTMRLARQVTAALKDIPGGIDIEIIERHHRFKEDAPSGTALKFGELIAEELQRDGGSVRHAHGREGKTGRRSAGEIGYHAVRVGDNPGEHTIVFGMLGEKIELNVAASSRDCYATGAIAAAKWLQTQNPGLYDMFDVLGMGE